MKQRTSDKRIKCIQILCGIIMILSLFLRFYVKGEFLYGWQILQKILTERKVVLEYSIFLVIAFFDILYLLRTILLIAGRRIGVLYHLAVCSAWVACIPMGLFVQVPDPGPYLIPVVYVLLVSGAEFLSIRFFEQKREMDENYIGERRKRTSETCQLLSRKVFQELLPSYPEKFPVSLERAGRFNAGSDTVCSLPLHCAGRVPDDGADLRRQGRSESFDGRGSLPSVP